MGERRPMDARGTVQRAALWRGECARAVQRVCGRPCRQTIVLIPQLCAHNAEFSCPAASEHGGALRPIRSGPPTNQRRTPGVNCNEMLCVLNRGCALGDNPLGERRLMEARASVQPAARYYRGCPAERPRANADAAPNAHARDAAASPNANTLCPVPASRRCDKGCASCW